MIIDYIKCIIEESPLYHQIQIVDKNRLQYNAFSKSMQIVLAKIANSWITAPPDFSDF